MRYAKTSYAEVVQQFGEPRSRGTMIRSGQTVNTIVYMDMRPASDGENVPTRASAFHFVHGLLVGYDYASSFPDDTTKFDESIIARVKQGATTKDQVLAWFGTPGGMWWTPLISRVGDTGLVYTYVHHTKSVQGLRMVRKTLIITYGWDGLVTNVSYTDPAPMSK